MHMRTRCHEMIEAVRRTSFNPFRVAILLAAALWIMPVAGFARPARSAASSGNGRLFTAVQAREGELWVKRRSGPLTRLTQDGMVAEWYPPVVQPGGGGVAYVCWMGGSEYFYRLYYLGATDTTERLLVDSDDLAVKGGNQKGWNGPEGHLSWAPDGRSLLLEAHVLIYGQGESMAEQRQRGKVRWVAWHVQLDGRRTELAWTLRRQKYQWRRTRGNYVPVKVH